MTLHTAITIAADLTGAPRDRIQALSGRFNAPEWWQRTFNAGHVRMLVLWWEHRQR